MNAEAACRAAMADVLMRGFLQFSFTVLLFYSRNLIGSADNETVIKGVVFCFHQQLYCNYIFKPSIKNVHRLTTEL